MSDYYKSLDPTCRVRHVEKLSYLSLKEAEDPCCNRDQYKDDMSKWPPVEFGHPLLLRGTSWTPYEKRVASLEKLR